MNRQATEVCEGAFCWALHTVGPCWIADQLGFSVARSNTVLKAGTFAKLPEHCNEDGLIRGSISVKAVKSSACQISFISLSLCST